MSVSDYWHLQKLDSTGQSRRQPLEAAYQWLHQQAPTIVEASEDEVRLWQARLLGDWRQGQQALALLCLRCVVSHAILRTCLQFVSQFGDYYQFRDTDLLPFVLDDEGKPLGTYQPLGVHIVETYTPGRASLEGWAAHLTRNHSELNQFLIERGLYRVSDWAILNDTRPGQLPKILGEFHRFTEAEIAAATTLLSHYHGVYRRDRLQLAQGQTRTLSGAERSPTARNQPSGAAPGCACPIKATRLLAAAVPHSCARGQSAVRAPRYGSRSGVARPRAQ